jgi:hypothetical protein
MADKAKFARAQARLGKNKNGDELEVSPAFAARFKCSCAITTREIANTANTVLVEKNWDGDIKVTHVLATMHEFAEMWLAEMGSHRDTYERNDWLPTRRIGNNYIFEHNVAVVLVAALVDWSIARQASRAGINTDDAEWELVA